MAGAGAGERKLLRVLGVSIGQRGKKAEGLLPVRLVTEGVSREGRAAHLARAPPPAPLYRPGLRAIAAGRARREGARRAGAGVRGSAIREPVTTPQPPASSRELGRAREETTGRARRWPILEGARRAGDDSANRQPVTTHRPTAEREGRQREDVVMRYKILSGPLRRAAPLQAERGHTFAR